MCVSLSSSDRVHPLLFNDGDQTELMHVQGHVTSSNNMQRTLLLVALIKIRAGIEDILYQYQTLSSQSQGSYFRFSLRGANNVVFVLDTVEA